MTQDRGKAIRVGPLLILRLSAALFVLALMPSGGVLSQSASLPEPSADLKRIRERYLDLVRYRQVDWEDPEIVGIVEDIEFQTGKLLQQQVTDAASPWHGCFHQTTQQYMGGQELVVARQKTEKAIQTFCAAYWCKDRRFWKSERLLRSIALGHEFLNRNQELKDAKGVYEMVGPYEHTRENLSKWFAQVGEFLPRDVRVDMKGRLRRMAGRTKTRDISHPLDKLVSAACLEDDRVLRLAARDMAQAAERKLSGSDLFLGPSDEISIEKAAKTCVALAQYQYFTRDTSLALPEMVTTQTGDLLSDFLLRVLYQGRADLLTYRFPYRYSGEVEQQIAIAAACLAIVDPERRAIQELDYEALLDRAFGSQKRSASFLDLYLLTVGMPRGPLATAPARITTLSEGGYLAACRPGFFASLRLPLARDSAAEYSRFVGAINLRSAPNDPNLLYTMPDFEPLLPGVTFSPYVARKKGDYVVRDNSQTTCADAAVLGGSTAVAGMRMAVTRKENTLRANKSWTFLEDKVIVAASGIEARSLDRRNCAWAASPTDHRARLTFFFRKAVDIDFVRIYFHVQDGKLDCVPRLIYFMVSDDGTKWVRVRTVSQDDLPRSGDLPLGGLTFRVRKTTTNYFRLYFPLDADGITTQIAEVELYNIDAKKDTDPVPSDAVNLARPAQVFASSKFNDMSGPERANDGDWVPALEAPLTRTCLAILTPRGHPFTYLGPKGICRMPFPDMGKEERMRDVRWCHIKQTAYFFLRPANLILRGVGNGYGTILIDHSECDSFAVVCFPDLDLEQTARAAEAGLVKVLRLDGSAHIFLDETSGLTSASFFSAADGPDLSSEGPAYLLYRRDPGLLTAAKSRCAAPSDVWISAPDATALVLNDAPERIQKSGPMVRISAHR